MIVHHSLSQDMDVCDEKGRDCIERSSTNTFNCSTTCVGIYADVQWAGQSSEQDSTGENGEESMKAVLEGKIDDDLLEAFLLFKTEMMKHVKNDVEDVMKIATGQRGEELDRKKYEMLISKYREFKTKNVKHFRLKSAANLSTFGKGRPQ